MCGSTCSFQSEKFGFFFQAEDGIRDAQGSRGLGDVYKRQEKIRAVNIEGFKGGRQLNSPVMHNVQGGMS